MIKNANHRFFLCSVIACFLILFAPPFTDYSLALDQTEIQTLKNKLNDPDANFRRHAAETVGKIGPEVVQALVGALKDENEVVRKAAAFDLWRLGPEAKAAVPTLIEMLKDKDKEVRLMAARVLEGIGPAAKAAVPALIEVFKDKDENVRVGAAEALGKIGPEAVPALIEVFKDEDIGVRGKVVSALRKMGLEPKKEVAALIEVLNDEDSGVRWRVAKAKGNISTEVVPALIKTLKDEDERVRWYAVGALGLIGPDAKAAVPALIEVLKDEDGVVRGEVAEALGKIGPGAKAAVPALIEVLKDGDKSDRLGALVALGGISTAAKAAVPALIRALKDEDVFVREQAAQALKNIGSEAKAGVPTLIRALKDEDVFVRWRAAEALGEIAVALGDAKATDMIKDLKAAEEALFAYPELEEIKKEVTRSIERLRLFEQIKPTWLENILNWVSENKLKSALILAYMLWAIVLLNVFWLRPLALLRINHALKPLDIDLKYVKLPLRFLLFIGLFNYHPRVLDAYITKYIPIGRKNFEQKATVGDRRIHINMPVELDRKTVPELTPKLLRPIFARQVNCLLILGEGGSGKTSLACQISKWAMAEDKEKRLCNHLMLPIIIEQELSSETVQTSLIDAVGMQLQDLTDQANPISEELLERLLRQRRIIVIVDHLSEMNEVTRKLIDPGQKGFAINAFVVTSRFEETLGGKNKTVTKPLRIVGNRLSSFMEAYLVQKGKREIFDDPEFFDACRRLSEMVGDRDITVLLAKLYSDLMIASKEGFTDDKIPDNIPDLMLSYLNELNHNVPADFRMEDLVIHHIAKTLAWECLKETFRPHVVRYEQAKKILDMDNFKDHLEYLEKRLRLIKTVAPVQDRFQFLLDPLAEYLAGLYILDLYGENEEAWNQFLVAADQKEGAPAAISGFLLAVRDCCLAKGRETKTPAFVAAELVKRAGMDPEVLKQAQLDQRIKRLIQQLDFPLVEDRISAADALGQIGPEAKSAVPDLIEVLKDDDGHVRESATVALGKIGPEAKAAVPYLIEVLKNKDKSDFRRLSALATFHESAAGALGKIGIEAVPALIEALKDKDKSVRIEAAWALSQIGPEAVPVLIEALEHKNAYVRGGVAGALGKIGPGAKSAVPDLIEALKNEDKFVRGRVVEALGKIGIEAVPALIKTLNDKDKSVRVEVAWALGEIGSEALPALIEALKDENIYVRQGAAWALEKINTPESRKALEDYKQKSD